MFLTPGTAVILKKLTVIFMKGARLFLKNAVAKESFFIKRTTGDVTLEKCDADEIDIKTDTGDVTGTLLSEKTFVVSTDTGNINVPDGTAEGKCEITTTTGDVKIKVTEKNSK